LDDYIAAAQNLLVVAAKQSDLGKGFTQLAGELMSLRDADRRHRFPNLHPALEGAAVDLAMVYDRLTSTSSRVLWRSVAASWR
jgi:hypothetical protein